MNTEEKRLIKMGFPFDLYLKQLFSADSYVRYINPFNFWHRYKINHLETCRDLNPVQHFERCHQLDWQPAKPTKIWLVRDNQDTLTNSLIQQAELNTIHVSQPVIKLKYRGVSYCITDVLSMNIQLVTIEPIVVKINSLTDIANSNNVSTSKKSSSN